MRETTLGRKNFFSILFAIVFLSFSSGQVRYLLRRLFSATTHLSHCFWHLPELTLNWLLYVLLDSPSQPTKCSKVISWCLTDICRLSMLPFLNTSWVFISAAILSNASLEHLYFHSKSAEAARNARCAAIMAFWRTDIGTALVGASIDGGNV